MPMWAPKNDKCFIFLDWAEYDLGQSPPLSLELNVQNSVWSLRGVNLNDLAVYLNLGEMRSEIEVGAMEA